MKPQLYPTAPSGHPTDSQWDSIKELVSLAKAGGRPCSLDIRQVINAILYVTVGGIPSSKVSTTATIAEVCATAWQIFQKKEYLNYAKLAWEWFHGQNSEQLVLYDSETDGCHDGLGHNSLNNNQGAESNITFLQAGLALYDLSETSTKIGRPLHGNGSDLTHKSSPAGIRVLRQDRDSVKGENKIKKQQFTEASIIGILKEVATRPADLTGG